MPLRFPYCRKPRHGSDTGSVQPDSYARIDRNFIDAEQLVAYWSDLCDISWISRYPEHLWYRVAWKVVAETRQNSASTNSILELFACWMISIQRAPFTQRASPTSRLVSDAVLTVSYPRFTRQFHLHNLADSLGGMPMYLWRDLSLPSVFLDHAKKTA